MNLLLLSPDGRNFSLQTPLESDLELLFEQSKAILKRAIFPVVAAVPHQLQQRFYNLVNNAVDLAGNDTSPVIEISKRDTTSGELADHPEPDPD